MSACPEAEVWLYTSSSTTCSPILWSDPTIVRNSPTRAPPSGFTAYEPSGAWKWNGS